jgi:hypothetical protein
MALISLNVPEETIKLLCEKQGVAVNPENAKKAMTTILNREAYYQKIANTVITNPEPIT